MFRISDQQNKSLDIIVVSSLQQYPHAKVCVEGTDHRLDVCITPEDINEKSLDFSVLADGTIMIHNPDLVYGEWDDDDDCSEYIW